MHPAPSRVYPLASLSFAVFLAAVIYGEFWGGTANATCYRLLGCNAGFAGFDAFEHFLFGFAAALIVVWLCHKYPEHSILDFRAPLWKSGFILVATVMLLGVFWEMGEWFRDAYLIDIAQLPIFSLNPHMNHLAQASNFDTMGDLAFTLLASLLALPLLRRYPESPRFPVS